MKVGDKVAVIDDIIKGEVISVDNDLISIISSDEMTYQFRKSELVKIAIEQDEMAKYLNINNHLLKEKLDTNKKKTTLFKKSKQEVIMEVDLHIEKLVRSTKHLNNIDILDRQLDTAKYKIEYCISKRIPKLILIHGVGEGILKTELQNLLNKYPVQYRDASYQKYGLGATEVLI